MEHEKHRFVPESKIHVPFLPTKAIQEAGVDPRRELANTHAHGPEEKQRILIDSVLESSRQSKAREASLRQEHPDAEEEGTDAP